jgi:hypothetical protein
MSDEPKLRYPVVKNGQLSLPQVDTTAHIKEEPAIVYPKWQDQAAAQRKAEANGTRARLRGLTFGLSDRVEALASPGKYEDNLKHIQAGRDEYANDNPWTNIGNELLGGLVSGGAVSSGVRTLAAKAAPTVAEYAKGVGMGPLATRLIGHTAENAGMGEVSHQAQQPYDKVGDDLGKGALFGAAGGAVAGVGAKLGTTAFKGMSKIGQRIALAMGAVKPEDFATRKYIESLAAKGLKPEEIVDALKYLRGDDLQLHGPVTPQHGLPDLRPPIVVADAVPRTTLNVFAKGIKSSDKAAGDVTERMSNRNVDQGERLRKLVTETLSDKVDSTAQKEALIAERAAKSDPHYKAAYAVGAPDNPIIDQWINDRPVNSAIFRSLEENLKQNASKGLGQGRPMTAKLDVDPATGQFVWKQKPTIEDLDTLKKHIDAKLSDLWNPAKGQFNMPKNVKDPDAIQLTNQRDDLVKIINKLTPDGKGGSHYENARNAFADDSALIDAHREGQMVMRTRPEDVAKTFDKFAGKPELADQYRAGVSAAVNDLLDKADTAGGSAIVRRLYGSPGIQKKLEYVMANQSTGEQFGRSMAAEKAMVDTSKNIVPRNSVNDLLSDAEGFSLPLAAANALSGRFGAAANQLGRFGMGSIGGMAPEVGDDLARIAMMSPEEYSVWVAAQQAAQRTIGAKAKKAVGGLGQYVVKSVTPSAANVSGMVPVDANYGTNEDDYTYPTSTN